MNAGRDDEGYRHHGDTLAGELDEFLREYDLFDDELGLVVGPYQDESGTPVIEVNARTIDGPEHAAGVTYMYDTGQSFPRLDYETVEDEVYPAVVTVLAETFPGAQLQAYDITSANADEPVDSDSYSDE